MVSNKTIILICFFLCCIFIQLKAQIGTVAAGGVATGSGGSVTYSIGQIDYITATGSGGSASQGLQQPITCAGVIINTSLSNITVCANTDTGYTITNVTGTAPVYYQWQISTDNGTTYSNINGQTTNHLSLNGVTVSMTGYKYRCLTSNDCAGKNSNAATLTVNALPLATITANSSTTFCGSGSVVLAANTSPSYLWYKNNVAIAGAIYQTYTAIASGSYSVQVSNSNNCTAISSPIQVTKNPLPTVVLTTSGPTTFCIGDSVVIASTTNATNPLYQWYKNSTAISGATNSSYSAKATGKYNVQITNNLTGCTKASTKVSVTVNCKTGDEINLNDKIAFYPNPTTGLFNLSFNSETVSKGDIVIYNNLGEKIYTKAIEIAYGDNITTIDLSSSPTGIYIIQLKTDSDVYSQRIVRQ